MARAQTTACDSCPSGRIHFGESFCGSCGHPSTWASYDERIDWEVAQWRRDRERSHCGGVATMEAPLAGLQRRSSIPNGNGTAHTEDSIIDLDRGKLAVAESTRISLLDVIRRIARRLDEMFSSSLPVRLDLVSTQEAPAIEAIRAESVPAASAPTVAEAFSEPVTEPAPNVPEPEVFEMEASAHTLAGSAPEPAPVEYVTVVDEPAPVAQAGAAAASTPAAVTASADVIPPVDEIRPAEPMHDESTAPTAKIGSPEAMPHRPVSRKRPSRPTNKEMLKRALEVLTKVEQRLEHLEQEMNLLDVVVRDTRAESARDELAHVEDIENLPY